MAWNRSAAPAARRDRRARGLEPVVELSPAAVYRPGAVFTMRNGKLVRMRFEVEANLPDDLFPFDDEFPAGVDCAPEPGRIVVTFGRLAEGGTDDSRFDITRSLYRAVGVRFDVVRRARFRIGTDPAAPRRWPELRGDPFISCSDRVRAKSGGCESGISSTARRGRSM